MSKYKIYMVKLGSPKLGNQVKTGAALKGLVDQVILSNQGLKSRFAGGADVSWVDSCPDPAPHELLIYVLANSSDSIVSSMPGISGSLGSPGSDGLTVWADKLTASEIYTNKLGSNPAMMAKLAFHEAMHNKAQSGEALHSGGGLAVSPLTELSKLSSRNIKTMAGALGKSRPQWAGGCSAYSDPLRGL